MNDVFEIEKYIAPPNEYGIVSFYWWVGDELKKDRLLWQLERLENMNISGLQINYCHTDSGGNIYGLPFESRPKQFTDEWWEMFNWFLSECEKRGISVSLSDYTLGSPGQGYYTDEILAEHPELRGGTIECRTHSLKKGERMQITNDPNRVSLFAYPIKNGLPDGDSPVDLSALDSFTADCDCTVAEIAYKQEKYSIDPMKKGSGEQVISKFFDRFEKQNPGKCGKALNFFFSDELNFGIAGNLWNNSFRDEFINRKGYDPLPVLYGVFADIGPVTQKIRLDYYDVIVSLEEENYFRPVFDWHEERGMTYGCDHGGRGYEVTEFGDYFRTQKYNQGPGNDQPGLASDIIKNKVASSISHLYSRPRTWLEGFYGSGWGTGSGQVLDAVCRNFAMGHNLLSLHGLYYTTYGGFWEWAPPCNHFRMPYWMHMKKLTECVARMSYLGCLGVHRCDVAILYPVAAVEGGLDGEKAVDAAFRLGRHLYKNGMDFDFIDFESVVSGEIRDGRLYAGNARYRAVILPFMKTVRYACLLKLLKFKEAGGRVICLGDLPEASDRAGREDSVLNDTVSRLFDRTQIFDNPEQIYAALDKSFTRDFAVIDSDETPYFMHRQVGEEQFYTVYGLKMGTNCFFRAAGQPLLLDVLEAKIYKLTRFERRNGGTVLPLPLDSTRPQVIVFTEKPSEYPLFQYSGEYKAIPVSGSWKCRLLPTMDNSWGDYFLPAENRIIGPQIRRPVIDGKKTAAGFGPYFKILGPVPPDEISGEWEEEIFTTPEKYADRFSDYEFSWRFGREGDPGHQGWHGLKGKVTDEFITLGRRVDCHHEYRYEEEISGGVYYLYTNVYSDKPQTARILTGSLKPEEITVNGERAEDTACLKPGYNTAVFKFTSAGRSYIVFERENKTDFVQEYPLSMSWYKNPNILRLGPDREPKKEIQVTFDSPPGMWEMMISTDAELTVRIDGKDAACTAGNGAVTVQNPAPVAAAQQVEITALSKNGERGGAVLTGYIEFECAEGEITLGDWGNTDGLENYSGAVSYKKSVSLTETGGKTALSLGEVAVTAEVKINGRPAGVLVAPPYELDITDLIKNGENEIEVTVCNTLYNHYKTIPTKYNQPQRSGLIGPVEIRLYGNSESAAQKTHKGEKE